MSNRKQIKQKANKCKKYNEFKTGWWNNTTILTPATHYHHRNQTILNHVPYMVWQRHFGQYFEILWDHRVKTGRNEALVEGNTQVRTLRKKHLAEIKQMKKKWKVVNTKQMKNEKMEKWKVETPCRDKKNEKWKKWKVDK